MQLQFDFKDPQRSPFAIQQLLGLPSNTTSNSANSANTRSPSNNPIALSVPTSNPPVSVNSSVSSLCISNLVNASSVNSVNVHLPQAQNSAVGPSYFHHHASRGPPTSHHPSSLLSQHQAAAHCFTAADSAAANAARLAYFNSAAFMSLHHQNAVHPANTGPMSMWPCPTGPSGPFCDSSPSPRPDTGGIPGT